MSFTAPNTGLVSFTAPAYGFWMSARQARGILTFWTVSFDENPGVAGVAVAMTMIDPMNFDRTFPAFVTFSLARPLFENAHFRLISSLRWSLAIIRSTSRRDRGPGFREVAAFLC